jgi:hypothetical protein
MEPSGMTPSHAIQARSARWSLEVVRGRDVGKVFELPGGEVVLGNGLDGAGRLDLRDQESGSPRRMAARQAAIAMNGTDLAIRDLDSPGGTFVNRQRLLSGQPRRLRAGDEIQLGGVLLRVVAGSMSQPSTGPLAPTAQTQSAAFGRLAVPYTIDGVVVCRSWDDFLVAAAQRWNDLRDELESGRLADYLRRIRSIDLLPRADASATPDERLDHWLGRLPVSRSSAPELDVHPAGLELRSTGGTTRHVLKIANVGYRLLRGTARVEPAGASWIRLLSPFDGRPFVTVEQTEILVEVTVPEDRAGPLNAEVVIESNGGTRRIPVRLGQPHKPPAIPDAAAPVPGTTISDVFRPATENIRRLRPPERITAAIVTALVVRALVLVSSLMPLGPRGLAMTEPRLPALAVLCAALGVGVGLLKALRRRDGGPLDTAASAVASGLVAILAAAVVCAVVKTIERLLGDWSTSLWALALLWAVIGAAVAGLSFVLIPYRQGSGESSA